MLVYEQVRQAKTAYTDSLFMLKNVVGVGVGYKVVGGKTTNELCVVVSVVRKSHLHDIAFKDLVPLEVDGIRTDVVETGVIRALRTGKYRPAPGGVSIGHFSITAGTLGCLVTRDGETYILSNNHVLAASNVGKAGDVILQPGAHDGGTIEEDPIAALEDFVPVEFLIPECPFATATVGSLNLLCRLVGSGYRYRASRQQQAGTNLVDAAIAKPLDDAFVDNTILEIGVPNGIAEGKLSMAIQKSGRTTGLTHGQITQMDATIQVLYGNNIALFEDQLLAGEMCAGGDSGSAVLTDDNRVVGLLFAGGEGVTVFNRIQNVLDLLGVAIGE